LAVSNREEPLANHLQTDGRKLLDAEQVG